jgi:hypothetical protein
MVDAYWEVGRIIVEEEQAGKGRADCGKRVLEELPARLTADFGKDYDPSKLRNMRSFFLVYSIRDAPRHELSWTHHRPISARTTIDRSSSTCAFFLAYPKVDALHRQSSWMHYQRELTAAGENPPIGIVLCTDKSEAVVRCTLPEGNTPIFLAVQAPPADRDRAGRRAAARAPSDRAHRAARPGRPRGRRPTAGLRSSLIFPALPSGGPGPASPWRGST